MSDTDKYLPISEFASAKGISNKKAIEMIRDGFYSGGEQKDGWYVHMSEISEANISEI